MRILANAFSLLLAMPLSAAGPSFEALRASAEAALPSAVPSGALRFSPAPRPAAAPQAPADPIVQAPKLAELGWTPSGTQLARANLSAMLDRHRDLLTRQLGARTWNIGAAADPKIEKYYLTFQQAGKLIVRPVGDLNRLTSGVDIEIEPGLVYNFKVRANIFNPVRGSKLQLTPAQGTNGPAHEMKTGSVLDALKARTVVFSSDGVEYWMGFSTDVDPATGQFAATRSVVFFHENGMSSKIWPVAESALPLETTMTVELGDNTLAITRTASGDIIVQKP